MNQRVRYKRQMRKHRHRLVYYLRPILMPGIIDEIYKENTLMKWIKGKRLP